MQINSSFVISNNYFFGRIKGKTFAFNNCIFVITLSFGHVIQTQYHVLRWNRNRCTICRVQDIVSSEHQHLSFQNCSISKWNVNRHLVTVEIGVECSTHQWVQLNRFSFNQLWLECLDTQSVKGWGPV
ncbi:MAG: hypothetical protein BWY67_00579 [Bacteroidetes bacterium ADurb.Bin397]|nr:MAG: hypothetical protein BWY67_00579 [Bacteroidetes bacterium ADurb.Bin397]